MAGVTVIWCKEANPEREEAVIVVVAGWFTGTALGKPFRM